MSEQHNPNPEEAVEEALNAAKEINAELSAPAPEADEPTVSLPEEPTAEPPAEAAALEAPTQETSPAQEPPGEEPASAAEETPPSQDKPEEPEELPAAQPSPPPQPLISMKPAAKPLNAEQKRIIFIGCAVIGLVTVIVIVALALLGHVDPPEPSFTTAASETTVYTEQPTANPQPEVTRPVDPEYERGVALYNAGDYEGAVAALTRALPTSPENTKIYTFRGSAYMSLQMYAEAIADLTRAIELDPANKYAYDFRARAYDAAGNTAAAAQDRDKAATLSGTY
ncbi:MAG: tetratricopeptide repeat protein [Oscillospiraceae bacterium]|jgi:tetratricopeptide (TPR) repeat protein|nr:tetratricopeptide repeat protein [Oscillospiraceae bacterium]